MANSSLMLQKKRESQRLRLTLVFTTHYEIIECILSGLSGKDLTAAALVCKSWNQVVKNVRRSRAFLDITVLRNKEIQGNLFQNCVNPENEPQVTLTFIRYAFYNLYCYYILNHFGINKYNNSLPHNQLRKCVPKNCASLMFTCNNSYAADRSGVIELNRGYDIVTLSLPQHVKVTTICFDVGDETKIKAVTEPVRLAIIFGYSPSSLQDMEKILRELTPQQVAAYTLSKFNLKDNRQDVDNIKALIFSGDNLTVRSITIPKEAIDSEDIKYFISKLGDPKLVKKNKSLGFILPVEQKTHIATHLQMFSSKFPNTLLVGMEVSEILKCNLNKCEVSSEPKQNLSVRIPGVSTLYYKPVHAEIDILLLTWS